MFYRNPPAFSHTFTIYTFLKRRFLSRDKTISIWGLHVIELQSKMIDWLIERPSGGFEKVSLTKINIIISYTANTDIQNE